MIETLNQVAEAWGEMMLLATLQNSVFLCLLLLGLFLLRKKDARALRLLALLGVLKLFLPPMSLLPESAMPMNFVNAVGSREIVVWGVEPVAAKSESVSLQSVLLVSWLVGSLSFFTIAILKTVRLKQRFEEAKPIQTSAFAELPKGVRVVQSESVHSPFVYGVFRPTIVLPKSFDKWSASVQSAVLAHEIAHLRQYDHFLTVLKSLAKAIHFFNPLVFLFFKRLDELCEMCCDDEATNATNLTQADYANALIAVAEREESQDLTGAIAFSEQFNSLKQRILYQLSKKEDFKMKNLVVTLSAIVMIALSLNCTEEKQPDATLNTSTATKTAEPPDFINVEKDPEFITRATVKYPDIAKEKGIEARVIVKALIGEDGLPKKALVVKYTAKDTANSPERQALEQAAIEATLASTFSPAEVGGKKLTTWLMIPYQFKLKANNDGEHPKLTESQKEDSATHIVSITPHHFKVKANNGGDFPKLIEVVKEDARTYIVSFTVPRRMSIEISLHDANFKFLKTLNNEIWQPHLKEDGKTHVHHLQVRFDMSSYPKGKYWVKMTAENYVEAKPLMVE